MLLHLPWPRLCPCGVVHKPPVDRRLAERLRPYFETVSSTWTNPSAGQTLDLAAGAVVTEAIWDAIVSNLLWLGGATGEFVDFTPTLTQGSALTLSSAVGRYWQSGKLFIATINIGVNSAGSAGNGIVVGGLPVSLQTRGGGLFGVYQDVSTANYSVGAFWLSNTSFYLTAGGNGYLGTAPNMAAAAGDTLSVTVIGEAA